VPVCRVCRKVKREFALQTSSDYWTGQLNEARYRQARLKDLQDRLPAGAVRYLRDIPQDIQEQYDIRGEVDQVATFLEALDQYIEADDKVIARLSQNVEAARQKLGKT
jgi:hypothetical protein